MVWIERGEVDEARSVLPPLGAGPPRVLLVWGHVLMSQGVERSELDSLVQAIDHALRTELMLGPRTREPLESLVSELG